MRFHRPSARVAPPVTLSQDRSQKEPNQKFNGHLEFKKLKYKFTKETKSKLNDSLIGLKKYIKKNVDKLR